MGVYKRQTIHVFIIQYLASYLIKTKHNRNKTKLTMSLTKTQLNLEQNHIDNEQWKSCKKICNMEQQIRELQTKIRRQITKSRAVMLKAIRKKRERMQLVTNEAINNEDEVQINWQITGISKPYQHPEATLFLNTEIALADSTLITA